MSRYKLTCSLLNNWMYAIDPEADEKAFVRFLDTLERRKQSKSKAMQAGIEFENEINYYVKNGLLKGQDGPTNNVITCMGDTIIQEERPFNDPMSKAIRQFGNRCRGGQLQVREEKAITLAGMDIDLVGIADCLKCGILYDIKRVQRYEYGKYQFSAQHPMYMELFPEAIRFDYLIFDGTYCYREQYRRGDFEPIQDIGRRFLHHLEDVGLMDTYKEHWRVNE